MAFFIMAETNETDEALKMDFDKTLLVISYYFPPMGLSGVQRTIKFIKYLRDYGWNSIVLTDTPDKYYAFDESLTEEIMFDDVVVYRTPGKKTRKESSNKVRAFPSYFVQRTGRYLSSLLYQPDRMIKWKDSAVKLAEKIVKEHNINAIYATAPPFTDFLVASEVSQKHKIPFVMDYRDIWIDNTFHSFPTPYHKNKCINYESELLKHAAKAFVTSRYAKELLIKRYRFLTHDDVVILTHGYDPEDFNGVERVKDNSKFVITHSGVFQDNRTPKYFLKALLRLLEKRKDAAENIEARFVGIMRKNHQNIIKKLKLENNVIQTGYLPHKEAVSEIINSDVLWLMLKDKVRTPGKLYEYFGAGKPVLICSPDGIMRKTALESGAAWATDPDDTDAIYKALSELYDLWRSNKLPTPNEEFKAKFDRKELSGTLARELAMIAEFK